ncbi:MAG: AAA family ATPase [Magnetococcales bacterium]|nr:AAA family ATPase [Magnetococcales bacterium]
MHLKSIHIQNYRRLKNVHIDLDKNASIFVGANNSGKTSAAHLIVQFLEYSSNREPFTLYDFHAPSWVEFNKIGQQTLTGQQVDQDSLPCITMDLWLSVEDAQIHRVIDLLPSLDWEGAVIGVRLQLEPRDPDDLLNRFAEAHNAAKSQIPQLQDNHGSDGTASSKPRFHPWPKDLCDYLRKKLHESYAIHYYVLDRSRFDADWQPEAGYSPEALGEGTGKKCRDIINGLIRVDAMSAQRHLTDRDSSPSSRSESLSKRFSRFYQSRSQKHENDYQTMQALNDSEQRMNDLFGEVFSPTLNALQQMGYPGFANPHLQIRSSINPERLLRENADVHYALNGPGGDQAGTDSMTLPDRYNGLGFKNLIYMIVELMDYHEQWLSDEAPPLIHLIIIEEPEAHLHVQLQQVFIRQVTDLLQKGLPEEGGFASQLIVTTHSPHVIYEKGFSPIRYFRREGGDSGGPVTSVLNLSKFSGAETEESEDNRFLRRYMRLTHCDLFFADAAILVEGNVERLLLPLMIEKSAPGLMTNYLSVLEVGGAFAYRFRKLINFLGITTLIITDLDSVCSKTNPDKNGRQRASYSACLATEPNATTSNQTLKEWLPAKESVSDLLSANDGEKTQKAGQTEVRVAYQIKRPVTWNQENDELVGRTLEEMFALENLNWCQDESRDALNLRIRNEADQSSLDSMAKALFKRVNSDSFKKTEFALGLIMEDENGWGVPCYIAEGLQWLEGQLATPEMEGVVAELPSGVEP